MMKHKPNCLYCIHEYRPVHGWSECTLGKEEDDKFPNCKFEVRTEIKNLDEKLKLRREIREIDRDIKELCLQKRLKLTELTILYRLYDKVVYEAVDGEIDGVERQSVSLKMASIGDWREIIPANQIEGEKVHEGRYDMYHDLEEES